LVFSRGGGGLYRGSTNTVTMEIIQHARNVHELKVKGKDISIANISDTHWDNPHCERTLLKSHLDYCKKNNIPVFINGDFFCFMQGKYDPRRSKSDVRPEHNKANYIDAVIEDAVDWFTPYKDILMLIGYGNHETAIIKNLETDPLRRFVDLFNYTNKSQLCAGGYGGRIVISQNVYSNQRNNTNIKYFHGSGGGGVVTKGAINLTRALEMHEDMDIFTMGHIHENSARNDVREAIDFHPQTGYRVKQRNIHLMLTGTYKDEYGDGYKGWHIERGAPPKPVGGRVIKIYVRDTRTNGERCTKVIDSNKFPL
jgi:hypothetical protein